MKTNKPQRNKNQVVLKLKRKHDESPEETIVVEERQKKRTKVNFIDQFSKMGLSEQQQPTYCQKLFRYIGTGSREFDLSTKIKESQNQIGLPMIKTKKEMLQEENNENSMMMNIINGQITRKEKSHGFEIFELEQLTSNAHGIGICDEQYHYYYLDEVAKVEKGKKYAAIRLESFLVNEEDEYDDGFGTDDEKSVDYGDTPESSVESWEKDEDSSNSGGGGYYDRQSSDSYSDYL
jgi:hypothetical protein